MIEFKSNNLHPFEINGHQYIGYSDYWFMDEMVMDERPARTSGNGAMTNITDITRFEVPHLWIDYKYMDLETYRQFVIDTKPVEFLVSCYNIVYDKIVTHKMYLAPEQRKKLRHYGSELLGVFDTNLEFIGTNNGLDTVIITYDSNPPSGGVKQYQTQNVVKGIEYEIIEPFTSYAGYTFKEWNTKIDGSGISYKNGQIATANLPLTLYAIYQSSEKRTLSFDYGVGQIAVDSNGNKIYNKEVSVGKAVGELPNVVPNSIYYEGEQIVEPYTFEGWYSIYGGKGTKWTNNTIYNLEYNATIYAYMKPQDFTITFNSRGGNYTPTPITQPYASNIYSPYAPIKEGYTFMGWYKNLDNENENPYSFTIMPPKNITLYAKWKDNK